MVFSSPAFLFIFFPLFLAIYFLLPIIMRNGFILLASILFYLLGVGSLVAVAGVLLLINWLAALKIGAIYKDGGDSLEKYVLLFTIIANIAPLVFFKYLIFFASIINDLFGFNYITKIKDLHLVLPLGISFYVFHFISYITDVYHKKITPEKDLKKFAVYISLFPHLIAGPLVRYSEIKQQLDVKHRRLIKSDVFWGMVIFSIGLAKKTLIADPLGVVVDATHNPIAIITTYSAWLSSICYSFQIYFDFSGYTDMAIGMARMVGFRFPRNFNRPYAANTITEFWKRWHMTLSRWLRDYVYIPLGGNRSTELKTYRNLFVVFVVCGLWHGAAYTFLIWGVGHGLLIILERMGIIKLEKLKLGSIPLLVLTTLLWVPFRSVDLAETKTFFRAMFNIGDNVQIWTEANLGLADPKVIFILILSLTICLLKDRVFYKFRDTLFKHPVVIGAYSLIVYFLSCISIVEHGFNPFIYFQF
ncbi:MBOAT family O-acyltransferase [Ewingella americana]|uniref:Probable alginate O-acetylase n=1 Tax=Ewingella americana TaxID=41202 RepID=A0A502GKS8_9GAMM|nr:MBOAT family O-acyltransferase [Ewingella americana]TPG62739.1 MBOAT family protein [Ewingella americana]